MYRITRSILAGQPQAIRDAFQRRGILDYCTAYMPAPRPAETRVFVMSDGRVQPADGQVVMQVAREFDGGQIRSAA